MDEPDANEIDQHAAGWSKRQYWLAGIVIGALAVVGVVSLLFLLPGDQAASDTVRTPNVTSPQPDVDEAVKAEISVKQVQAASRGTDTAWLYIVAIVSAITALIAVLVAFYLYRWRRIFIAGHPNVLVPEDWISAIRGNEAATNILSKSVHDNLSSIAKYLGETIERLDRRGADQSDDIRKLSESLLTLQNALDERDREIARLKKGFDNHVYRKFLTRFIRVHEALQEIRGSSSSNLIDLKEMGFVEALLVDALEESEVTVFEPEIGEDVREQGVRVSDSLEIIETDDPDKDYRIAEIIAPGYETFGAEENSVIQKARVRIYRKVAGDAQVSESRGV